jgi:hypothetical protein
LNKTTGTSRGSSNEWYGMAESAQATSNRIEATVDMLVIPNDHCPFPFVYHVAVLTPSDSFLRRDGRTIWVGTTNTPY